MESGRFLLAIVLMIAVIVVTNLLFPPSPPQRMPSGAVDVMDTAQAPGAQPQEMPEERVSVQPEEARPTPAAAVPVEPAPGADAAADTVFVESPLYRYGFSTRGGGLVVAELLEWESFSRPGKPPADLVPADAGAVVGYTLRVGDDTVDLRDRPFQIEPAAGLSLAPGSGPDTLRLHYQMPDAGLAVELEYVFRPNRYVADVVGRVHGMDGAGTPMFQLELGPTLAVNEADPAEDYRALAYVVNSTERGISSVSLDDVEGRRVEEGPLVWAALKNKYFLVAALGGDDDAATYFGGLIATDVPGEHTAELTATLPVGRDGLFGYELYVGPQRQERLAALGRGLEDVNPLGWQIFRPIIGPLAHAITWALVGLQQVLGIGYGWILILFGFLLQVLMWPLQTRAMRSQMKNMELQPVMKELQQKYKSDPERLQKEMIRLYREEGFNPLGGCLPMLLPWPVLITLFFVFQSTIEFRGVEFLWLPDLSRPDPIYVLPILLGATMFARQWMSMRTTPTANPQMKMMLWIMPAFMVVLFLNFASGLNLYYAASNVAGIPQQLLIMKERRAAQGRLQSSRA